MYIAKRSKINLKLPSLEARKIRAVTYKANRRKQIIKNSAENQ